MDSKHDANELNLGETAGELPERRKKRRPLNPDGTPVRRPRPRPENAAEDAVSEAERLIAEHMPDADRPRKKRRPRNPDGTPVRRPRPVSEDIPEDGGATPADWERELEALQRPRKKRRPRPEEAAAETENVQDTEQERDFEEVQRQRRKRRMRPERAAAARAAADSAEDAEEAVQDALIDEAAAAEDELEELIRPRKKRRPRFEEPEETAAPAEEEVDEEPDGDFDAASEDDADEELPELDLDWRNDPEFADEFEKPKKKSWFARLFGSKDEPEEADFTEEEPYGDEDDLDGEDDERFSWTAKSEDETDEDVSDGEDLTDGDDVFAGSDEYDEESLTDDEEDGGFGEAYDGEYDGDEYDGDEYDEDEDEDEDDDEYLYDEEEPGRKSRALIIGIVAVCAVAVCITVGSIMYVKRQPAKMLDLLRQGDYSAAAEYYQNHSYAESEDIDRTIEAEADSIRQKYLNEELDYDTALEDMKQLEEIQSMRARTEFSCADAIELIHESRVHYDAGKAALESKNYDTAIEEFSKTCEADTKYYDEAQKLIKEAEDGREKVKNDAIQQIISDANALANSENPDYLAAYKKLTEAAPLYENDARITGAAEMMRTSFINDALASANNFTESHSYDQAISLLEAADAALPGTLELPAKIDAIKGESAKYEFEQHKQQVLAEAAEAFDLYGPENAIVILQSASDIAEDQDIRDKIAEYEAAKATVISALTVTDKHDAIEKLETAKTPAGTELKEVYRYRMVTTYNPIGITFATGEKGNNTLTFMASPDELFAAQDGCYAVIKVYADGALVKTTDKFNAQTEPFTVQAAFPETTKSVRIVAEDVSTPQNPPAKLFFDIYNFAFSKK